MVRILPEERRLLFDESLECLARSMEPYLYRVCVDRERTRGFVGIQLLDIAQHKDRSVILRQSRDASPDCLTRIATFQDCLGGVGPGRWGVDPLAILIEAWQQLFNLLFASASFGSQLYQRRIHDDPMKPC